MNRPQIIQFKKLGNSEIGYISVGEYENNVPFEIKRVFWTYYTPHSVIRGKHAHYKTEQLLIAVSGKITVRTEQKGIINEFLLDSPDTGVYIPPDAWHTMEYSHDAVQLVFASTAYDESDYIRDYNTFVKTYKDG